MARFFGEEFVGRVRMSSDIARVISEYVSLKKAGKRLMGRCPFHEEKTPSFSVNPEKQMYYCFGCKEGGDVFKFVQKYSDLDFTEAVERLANKAGLALPESQAESGATRTRQKLIEINEAACEYFHRQLMGRKEHAPVLEYLEGRGLSRKLLEEHRVGYAPDSWEAVVSHFQQRRIPGDDLVKAGLAVPRKNGSGWYDRFRDRVIFPIADAQGRVVAFGGRAFGKEVQPKYLNSPETAIYRKGEILYGFHQARDAIRKREEGLLVEGYVDVLALHEVGARHAVATCGTGFGAGHVKLLKRVCGRVFVNFDPDPAGRRAALRTLEQLLETGFEARVVILPGGEDPADFVLKHGGESYEQKLQEATDYVRFAMDEAVESIGIDSSRKKVGVLNAVLPVLARIENRIERIEYVPVIARRLGLEDSLVRDEFRKLVDTRSTRYTGPMKGSSTPKEAFSERRLIRVFLDDPEVASVVLPEWEEELPLSPISCEILTALNLLFQEGGELTVESVYGRLESDAARNLLSLICMDEGLEGGLEDARECLRAIQERANRRDSHRIQRRIEDAASQDAKALDSLLAEKLETARKRAQLM